MKRKLVLYGLLGALLVGGIPFVAGLFAQQRFQELANMLSDAEHIQMTVLEYERGVFHSTAKTRIVLSGERLTTFLQTLEQGVSTNKNTTRQSIKLVLEHSITHGPFVHNKGAEDKNWLFALAQITSRLLLTNEAKASLEKEISEKDFLLFNTVLALGDDISITLDGKPIQVLQDGVEETIWQGIQGKWQISETLDSMQGTLVIPGLYFEKHNILYEIENIFLMLDRVSRGQKEKAVWQANAQYKIEHLVIHNPEKQKLSLHKIVADTHSTTKVVDLRINSIEIGNQTFGPLAMKAVFSPLLVTGRVSVKLDLLKRMYQYQLGVTQSDAIELKIAENIKQKKIQENNGFYETTFEWSKGKLVLP